MNLPLAVSLMGPTASGKTGVAVELVQQLPLEIISVDSVLIYRGMDIGTAKPNAATLQIAPHRLIDIRDPAEAYSAAEFRRDALREMEQITSSGKIPLLVGGTMLYFNALEYGLTDLPAADPQVRAQLEAEAKEVGWAMMHARLRQVDPSSAARIHQNDPQRIQRALEVYRLTGKAMSELYQQRAQPKSTYRFLKIVLAPADRTVLHRRIEERFKIMLAGGFVDEVRALWQRPDLPRDLPAMRAVGYRQALEWLGGNLSEDEWVEKAVVATRQYAKRQLTWLRSEANTSWIDPLQEDDVAGKIAALIVAAGDYD